MQKLVALVGPTAVGKTETSILVAQRLGGEIISCDSMQVYRGMDIGTAKADLAEQARVPHHLIDVVDAGVDFTVADYQRLAQAAIRSIADRGRLPILVGGTGLYYQALVDQYDFFPIEARNGVRHRLERMCEEQGQESLFALLEDIDPDYAARIGPQDRKRIIRAMEVYELTGHPFSSVQRQDGAGYDLAVVGLYLDRTQLYARIEDRVNRMIMEGLVQEVAGLREMGCRAESNAMQALGYKQIFSYLEGMLNWEDCLRDIKLETRRFAKRQHTWFKRDQRILWLNVDDFADPSHIADKICRVVEGQFQIM